MHFQVPLRRNRRHKNLTESHFRSRETGLLDDGFIRSVALHLLNLKTYADTKVVAGQAKSLLESLKKDLDEPHLGSKG